MRTMLRHAVMWLVVTLVGCALVASLAGCTVELGQPQVVNCLSNGVSIPTEVAQDPQGGALMLVNVRIKGKGPYKFIVDTGAETSLLDTAVAQSLGLQRNGPAHQSFGIGGSEVTYPVSMAKWSAETLRLPGATIDSGDFTFGRKDQGWVGLLGSDIWNQFGQITLDYANQKLCVSHQIA